jgi:hypothetical protein
VSSATPAQDRARLIAERLKDEIALSRVVDRERRGALEANEASAELRDEELAAELDEAAVDLSFTRARG